MPRDGPETGTQCTTYTWKLNMWQPIHTRPKPQSCHKAFWLLRVVTIEIPLDANNLEATPRYLSIHQANILIFKSLLPHIYFF